MSSTAQPTILALDAAGKACSAALWVRAGIAFHRSEAMARGHAEALMLMAEAVVADTGYANVDLVAVSIGPGAYTGLRIAIAAARGLGLSLDVPVMGISSLDVHLRAARHAGLTGSLAVLLETKRTDFYLQVFDTDDAPRSQPAAASGADVAALIEEQDITALAGDAVDRFAAEADSAVHVTCHRQDADADVVAELAAAQAAHGGIAHIKPPRPMYLRAPDTSPPTADRQRLRG